MYQKKKSTNPNFKKDKSKKFSFKNEIHLCALLAVAPQMGILPQVSKLLFRKTVGEEGKQLVGEGNMRVGG